MCECVKIFNGITVADENSFAAGLLKVWIVPSGFGSDSINGLGRNLSKNYISSGLTTPSKIRNKYCKGNKTWPQKVSAEMNEIRNFLKKRYEL